MKQFKDHVGFGLLLGLILPGAGHLYFREYLFGVFVMLIMLTAAALFFLSFLVDLPAGLSLVLFGLPTVFYLFSFVDLWRSVQRRQPLATRPGSAAYLFVVGSLMVTLLLPLSPVNLLLRNAPEIIRVDDPGLSPLVAPGDLCWVDRMAYRVKLFFLEGAVSRGTPDRWDIILFESEAGGDRIGLVIGLAGEEVRIVNDSLYVDGYSAENHAGSLEGMTVDLPLTGVDYGAILVMTPDEGAGARNFQVPLRRIRGEVHHLF